MENWKKREIASILNRVVDNNKLNIEELESNYFYKESEILEEENELIESFLKEFYSEISNSEWGHINSYDY